MFREEAVSEQGVPQVKITHAAAKIEDPKCEDPMQPHTYINIFLKCHSSKSYQFTLVTLFIESEVKSFENKDLCLKKCENSC